MPLLTPQKTGNLGLQKENDPLKPFKGSGIKGHTDVKGKFYKVKVKRLELIMFTTQLSVMLDSGVILSDALESITEQANDGSFKTIVDGITITVKNGNSFSSALADYPKVFSSMFVSMVKASEASGKMPEMLRILADYLEFEYEVRKRVKGALTYPFMMGTVAVAATGLLMFFILPKFMKIYESRQAALPKLTQILLDFSNLLRNAGAMTVIFIIFFCAAIGLYKWSRTTTGRKTIDYIKINLPILGKIYVDMIVARTMRIISTMIGTGVSLLDTIEVVHDACNNCYFQQLWDSVDNKIRNGYQFSEAVQVSPHNNLIEPSILQMIRAGEKGGNIGKVSNKVSLFYEKKLENSIVSVTKMIEPLMIIIMGCIIGIIAIALLLPVFRISSVLAH